MQLVSFKKMEHCLLLERANEGKKNKTLPFLYIFLDVGSYLIKYLGNQYDLRKYNVSL